jgi:hypothetical protein
MYKINFNDIFVYYNDKHAGVYDKHEIYLDALLHQHIPNAFSSRNPVHHEIQPLQYIKNLQCLKGV